VISSEPTVGAQAKRSLTPGPSAGFFPRDPLSMTGPCFRGLQNAEIIHPASQRLVGNDHRLRHPDECCELVERGPKRIDHCFPGDFQRVLRDEQSPGLRRGRIVARAGCARRAARCWRPVQTSRSIEARRERTNTIQRNPAVCRSYTEDSTETRRQTHRAARVAADCKIHHAGGNSRRRAAGRTARNAPGAFTFTGAP